jgi:hypothetical protein
MFVLCKIAPPRWAIRSAILFLSAACLAQTAEPASQINADDLKAIRADLDRLIQLTQELDKSQKAILAVQQIQMYQFRMQSLETRDDALAQRESQLSAHSATLERAAKDTQSGIGPTGVPGISAAPDSSLRREAAEQLDTNLRLLNGVRAKRQEIAHDLAALRTRIETLQKTLAAAGADQ